MSLLQDLVLAWLQRNPYAMRLLSGVMRRRWPIVALGSGVFVSRADDAREVYERTDDFEIGPLNASKMLSGTFLLGLDMCPRYMRERAALQLQLEAQFHAFAELSRSVAERRAEALRPALEASTPIDPVRHYAERVTTEVASRFFGVPMDGARSEIFEVEPGLDVLRMWLRKLGALIASRSPAPFGLEEVAHECARELRRHVERALREAEEEKRDGTGSDEEKGLLQRFAAIAAQHPGQIDDDWIVRNVIGLMLAGSTPIIKAFAHALDQLLQRPEHLAIAIERADRGQDDLLMESVREALRFNPVFPLLLRYCPRGTTLARGTSREVEIPAGATVTILNVGAMFDPEAVPEPERFGYGREDAATYLHFGAGSHTCLGKRHGEAELLELFRAFLRLPGVASLGPGTLAYDGPAVDGYRVGGGRR